MALLAAVEIPEEHRIPIEGCVPTADGLMCVVTAKALKEYMIKRVEMANELDALKASAPKCAKTEVIEPSKHKDAPITPPPKPAVPFKPERNL